MLYDLAIDEELEQMDEDDALRAWNAQEIQVSLKDLMRPIIQIDINSSTNEAIDLLLSKRTSVQHPVVENGHLRGIFSERDVLNQILNKQVGDLDDIGVTEFMIADPQTAQSDDTLTTAILHMARGGYRHVPIVDTENRPIGMVSIRDVMSYLVEEFLQEVLTLPPKPVRDALKAREGA